MTVIQFRILGENPTQFDGVTSFRVTCERLDNKEVFYAKSAISSDGKYNGGIVEEIKRKGETIEIEQKDGSKKSFVLRRDTGIGVTFSNIATQKASKEYADFVLAV